MSLLEVRGLCRDYGTLRAVDDVSFRLEAGSILGFIGPNGAGKSTTLRILATLDVPTSGEVLLDGMSLVDAPDKARPLIGYMPDRYGTYDDVTVAEFLDFFARAYGLKGAQRTARVASVMEFTGLTPLAGRLTTALSKGMRQRVALGRTLLHDPRLLLLDEPADGLDPRARIELRELLRALADQGKAVIISSHILTELAEICDTCAIIEQGRLLTTGTVQDLLHPATDAAASVELSLRLAVERDAEAEWARAERLLLEQPRVMKVVRDGQALRVRVELAARASPTELDAACAVLLSTLVSAGLPVCAFSPRERNLEDAFMTVTKGRVA
ncbi:ABC transporter ATP-binding protein [Corallococcus sp. H22C18031201]|uniref:ABC transporter ATP-binding protein n=1 Tax=Citreicoccus inhibens TaxID=2849499 RepID=UPI000E749556|nr:ABC transporter ATP-binding protein [Citreicoccus inhibens]MBU8895537.1 ABC transporter ATP-binding protein [Citreicoccus inhibens]RJS22437.1 ABC transporter ATP-binding protein [Corallococcus sp. H22C18031201]